MTLAAGIDIIKHYLETLPSVPGVYRMVDAKGNTLYVGKAKNLPKRVTNYTQPERLIYRIQQMVSHTATMDFVVTKTEAEALLLEASLIKKYSPRYNILLKDDKSFPYIFLSTGQTYPRIGKHRGERKEKGEYFGPFASAGDVNETIAHLQKIFLLRPCSDSYFAARTRPCLEYQIKRCSAPCVEKISPEKYAEFVGEARQFLQGKSRKVQEKLAKQMEEASLAMDYEKAAMYRDRIRALTQIQARQRVHLTSVADADMIGVYVEGGLCCVQVFFFRGGQNFGNRAYFPLHTDDSTPAEILESFIGQFYQRSPAPEQIMLSHDIQEAAALEEALELLHKTKVTLSSPKRGEKADLMKMVIQNAKEALQRKRAEEASQARLLEGVAELFGMVTPPNRIEIYDNSHIMGTHEVGVMVVAGPEGFRKQAYRRFNIARESVGQGDDYAMMREVFTRRFERLLREDPTRQTDSWPDLVLIDGGAGQLSAVEKVLQELGVIGVTYVGIAKGEDRNAGRERFFMPGREPFSLPKDDPVLYYLQRLRDEAHRFAIGSHRTRRQNALTRSALNDVPGIGDKRKKALLTHFGSVKAIEQATIEELMQVEGISRATAQGIHEFLRGS